MHCAKTKDPLNIHEKVEKRLSQLHFFKNSVLIFSFLPKFLDKV